MEKRHFFKKSHRLLFLLLIPLFFIGSSIEKDFIEARAIDNLSGYYYELKDAETLNSVIATTTFTLSFRTDNGVTYNYIKTNKTSKYIQYRNASNVLTTIYSRNTGYLSNMIKRIYVISVTSANETNFLNLFTRVEDPITTDISNALWKMNNSLNLSSLINKQNYNVNIKVGGVHYKKLMRKDSSGKQVLFLTNDSNVQVQYYHQSTGYSVSTHQIIVLDKETGGDGHINSAIINFFTNNGTPYRGIESNALLFFSTTVIQYDNSKFLLNGNVINEPGVKTKVDNVTMTFSNANETTTISNAFFKMYLPSIGNYVYGVSVPLCNNEISRYSSISFHLWNNHVTNNYPDVLDVSISIVLNKVTNLYIVDTANQLITEYSDISISTIYNSYGDYFLSKVTCSGRGDKTDETKVRNAWNTMTNEQIITAPKMPSSIKNYLKTYIASGTSNLAKAIERYDYIVFRKYGLTDFLSRGEFLGLRAVEKTNVTPIAMMNNDDYSIYIIIVASSVALLSITVLTVLIMKKKVI